jgi:hypothetical protein
LTRYIRRGRAPRKDGLEHRDVFQQRDYAEDNDDDARDLLGAAVERQQVDQIQDENDDEKRDEYAHKHPENPPATPQREMNDLPTRDGRPGSRAGTAAAGAIGFALSPYNYGSLTV